MEVFMLRLGRSILRRAGTASKIYPDCASAVADIWDGATLLVGGFGCCGQPDSLARAVRDKGSKNLTVVSNVCGGPGYGLDLLLQSRQIRRMIASHAGTNESFEKCYLMGDVEVEWTPQGSLAERVRAGGAGIPAFFTPAGVGTLYEEGGLPILNSSKDGKPLIVSKPREKRKFLGKPYLLEEAIRGDFSLIRGWKADPVGNMIFRSTARNFNQEMATAAGVTIAEVEEVVPLGSIPPDSVHLPGIYVHRIVKVADMNKRVENLILDKKEAKKDGEMGVLEKIARRTAQEYRDGMYVNLGIGLPTASTAYIPEGMLVFFQGENGILGIGPHPSTEAEVDPDLINAGLQAVTYANGASTFSSSISFAMIRGAHLDLTVLGALQVTPRGDLASWLVPGKKAKGMGGAMDLVSSGSRVVVCMQHTARGDPKIIPECTLPLTASGVVSRIITELSVFDLDKEGLLLVEISEGVSVDEIREKTLANFRVSTDLREIGY